MKELNCEECKGKCCRYVATEIDIPKSKIDYEEIRWYLLHENVEVFIEDDKWYIQFNTLCKELDKDGKCMIYDTRPKICRDLKIDECEFHGYNDPENIIFKNVEEFEKYLNSKDD